MNVFAGHGQVEMAQIVLHHFQAFAAGMGQDGTVPVPEGMKSAAADVERFLDAMQNLPHPCLAVWIPAPVGKQKIQPVGRPILPMQAQ